MPQALQSRPAAIITGNRMSPRPNIRCRQIRAEDQEAVADVLARGFPARPLSFWTGVLRLLAARQAPADCAQFGYLLEADGAVVGVHLLIFNTAQERPAGPIRCQASGWYVDPAFRSHAALLATMGTKLKHVTYLNTTADDHTWPILKAVGYHRYSQGQFAAIPSLAGGGEAKVAALDGEKHRTLPEYDLLRRHQEAGCLALVCETREGPKPFVFLRRRIRYAPIGIMQLIYCRDTAEFVACAGPLGRFLLTRRASCVLLDADGPVPGLVGRFFQDKNPRFFKGPERPRLNDLADSEMVLLGL
jgi:hypothetical protein